MLGSVETRISQPRNLRARAFTPGRAAASREASAIRISCHLTSPPVITVMTWNVFVGAGPAIDRRRVRPYRGGRVAKVGETETEPMEDPDHPYRAYRVSAAPRLRPGGGLDVGETR